MISFAIQAYDKMNNSRSQDGIFSAKMFIDDEPQIEFVLDSIDYDETVYINAHVDYKYRYIGGAWLQHLSQLPGGHGVAYRQIKGDGIISLPDTDIHLITIEVKDALNNPDILWFRSESGIKYPDPWYIAIEREMQEYITGKPWHSVFDALEFAEKSK